MVDQEKIEARKKTLQDKVDFINESYSTLTVNVETFSVDLTQYDLANPVSIAEAQTALALASQYVSVLTEKVDYQYHDFLAIADSFEYLFRDFHVQYLNDNPRPRGYPEELHTHAASRKFLDDEGWDREMVSHIVIRFKQIQKTLTYRKEHLTDVNYQLRAMLKNLDFSLGTQGGSQIITPQDAENFRDVSQPNPTQKTSTQRTSTLNKNPASPFMGIPPPALSPPALPPGFHQVATE